MSNIIHVNFGGNNPPKTPTKEAPDKNAKFKQDQVLQTRFISDWDSKLKGHVLKRTAKTITLSLDGYRDSKRCKIYKDDNNNEYCYPLGRYSMSPVFKANKPFV